MHSQELAKIDQVKFSSGDFVNIQFTSKPTNESSKDGSSANHTDDEDDYNDDEVGTTSELFSCPCQGCILSYKKHSNLEYHIQYGKCKLRKEKLTLLDQAKKLYSEKLNQGTSTQPTMQSTTVMTDTPSTLCQGWALRQSKKASRFSDNQRSYLDEKFDIGVTSGIKADPAQVARDLRHARNDSGDQRFKIDEFLSPQQIKSYFSRKAAKNRKASIKELSDNAVAAEDAKAYSEAREMIIQECELVHPIMFDTYDVCKLYAEKRLSKLSVALLSHICVFFNMDVESLTVHRKAPYISLINALVQSCTCCEG